MKKHVKNRIMTFPFKKRISTELFVERTAALYLGKTPVRVGTNESDQLVGLAEWRTK